MKLKKLLQNCNLSFVFRSFGTGIATYPWAFLIFSLILSILSFGIINIKIENRVRDGYTPSTSMSRYENNVLREFFGSHGN